MKKLLPKILFINNMSVPLILKKGLVLALFFLTFSFNSFSQTESILSGSIIIDMGVLPQTEGNALKPYGLVYSVIKNFQTPVVWAINPAKVKDGVDFTVDGRNFSGGSFIIKAQYVNTALLTEVANWEALGVVTYTTQNPIIIPIYKNLEFFANWVIDFQNFSLAEPYLLSAGIPSTAYRQGFPTSLGVCDDLFILPHADPTWTDHGRLLDWTNSLANGGEEGWLWSGCHAVSVLEALVDPADPNRHMNFLATAPTAPPAPGYDPLVTGYSLINFNNHTKAASLITPYPMVFPAEPTMQFLGQTDLAHDNGSEEVYLPTLTSTWRSTTKIASWDPNFVDLQDNTNGKRAALIAFGPAFGDPDRGRIMYEAGHRLNSSGSIAEQIAAQRAFLNFSFDAPQKKKPVFVDNSVTIPTSIVGGETIDFDVFATPFPSVPGSIVYSWISTCGGTFTNPTTGTATFNSPVVASDTECIISAIATDGCGRSSIIKYAITIFALPGGPIAVDDIFSITNTDTKTFNALTNDTDPNNNIDPSSFTPTSPLTVSGGVFSNNGNGNITFTPNTGFVGTAILNYQVCDTTTPTPICATATITITVSASTCPPGPFISLGTSSLIVNAASVFSNNGVKNPNNALGVADGVFAFFKKKNRDFVLQMAQAVNLGEAVTIDGPTVAKSKLEISVSANGNGPWTLIATNVKLPFTFTPGINWEFIAVLEKGSKTQLDNVEVTTSVTTCIDDRDGDFIADNIDIDDDNDGILDTVEDANLDGDNDPTTNPTDSDADGIPNYFDLDSDNDGIPDNIEGQSTAGYIPPLGADTDGNGLDDAYEIVPGAGNGLTVQNTDGTDNPDYLDLNSDNDGADDTTEAGLTLSGVVGDNGLLASSENVDNYTDVNGSFDNTQTDNFPDADGDVNGGGDVDYRDAVVGKDTDGDGILDSIDLDDDNDGILDVIEDAAADGDADGVINSVDLDSDGDGIPDNIEAQTTTGYIAPGIFTDINNNGVNDIYDVTQGGTAITPVNTDGTDNPDYLDLNSDNQSGDDTLEGGLVLSGVVGINGLDNNYSNGAGSYADVNGTFDDTQTNNFPDTDGDVLAGGDVDWRDNILGEDTDGDGVLDNIDIDDDNDGILDTVENNGLNPLADTDIDGIYNYKDPDTVGFVDTNADNIDDRFDFDLDGIINEFDLDADNDGIPDNIEAQSTTGYIAPNPDNAATYTTNNGLNSAYLTSPFRLTPTNTDGIDNPDYLDTDSDNDTFNDTTEAGLNLSGTVGVNGLDNTVDTSDNYADVNGTINNPALLPDNDGDVNTVGDVDYRDDDHDNDGIVDSIDLDDDNDGILDTIEDSPANVDTDGDGIKNSFDLDSDNDGIPDNVEAQPTVGYVTPGTFTDANNDGVNDIYAGGLAPQNTDGTDNPDYLDTDADNDGINDTIETNLNLSGTVGFNGLDNNIDTSDDFADPNGSINFPFILPDGDGDVFAGGDVNYRDADRDNDGIIDSIDLDDDNDGILDTVEDSPANVDTDGDGIKNSFDLDSDNDGIPDNIEAQTTVGYIAQGTFTDTNNNGVNDVYDVTAGGTAITPVNTDGTDNPDYLDTDSDNEGGNDTAEAGLTLSGTVGYNGLDNNLDIGDNYTDTNGTFDDTQTDNFPDADSDVNSGGDVDYRDALLNDNDNDGIPDLIDLDDDNDGILDTVEGTGDTDSDGIIDAFDLDSDNDGIPDNVEAQPTVGYIVPGSFTDTNNNGVNDVYDITNGGTAITPVNTDGTDNPDYLDTDADNDGINDTLETNLTLSGTVGNNGLDNNIDTADDYTDPNGSVNFPFLLPDGDGDVFAGGDVDYRDADRDNDGIVDSIDLDDDNDGILDVIEDANLDTDNDPATNPTDTDGDGIPDYFDLDSDNDGIPDNVEAQTTLGYITPGVFTDTNNNGVNDVYDIANGGTAITPVNTDGTDNPDYLDLDSDNDSANDTSEANLNLSGTVGYNGLDNNVDTSDHYLDPNGSVNFPFLLPDTDGDLNTGGDVDYRDSGIIDTDNDGIPDSVDIDDDNDGILDTIESSGDTDLDGIQNSLDLDADNDGIPDNIEAQSTIGYIAPSGSGAGITDVNNNGLDDNYETSQGGTDIVPVNTDGTDNPDYLDTDSDNDVFTDTVEAGLTLSGTVGINGLDSNSENVDNYTDVNGSFDNTQTNNFPDTDGDVLTGGDVDYRDTAIVDTDNDGIPDSVDLDDDNDGILDTIENGGTNPLLDTDNDGLLNYQDPDTAGFLDTNTDNIDDRFDSDLDGVIDQFDLDADNDGIPDNVEAQTTLGYIPPGVFTDTNNNGVNDVYDATNGGTAITPVNTDGTDNPDYLDTDSDNEGAIDTTEANLTLSGTVGLNGLDNNIDTVDDYTDVNGTINNPSALPDTDVDINFGGDVDFRDATNSPPDNDNDGIPDVTDLDDDNDGILDTVEDANLDFDNNPFTQATDTDGDGVPDYFDLDADNDGIPDNIEAQTTVGYIAPGTFTDTNNNGVNDVYDVANGGTAITPVNTDGTDNPDYLDLDDDNDGINDTTEANLTLSGTVGINGLDSNSEIVDDYTDVNGSFDDTQTNNFPDNDGDVNSGGDVDYRDNDHDNDGIPDLIDLDDDNDGILDTVEDSPANVDTDGDGIKNSFDLDADNDGIPDNVEAQPTVGYVAPGIFTDTNNDGVNDIYAGGLTPPNTDGIDNPDYLDTDSDNEGGNDTVEAGLSLSGTVGFNGLDSNIESVDDFTDVNGAINNPLLLPDSDGDVNLGGDVDYRDNTNVPPDNDNDGVPDTVDIDDDNDGILDTVEDANLDTDNNPATNPTDTDADGIPDYFDLDSDNDGIPDNVEAQPTIGYITPGTFTDADGNGLNDVYEVTPGAGTGLTPQNTDGIDNPDYLDTDSDNEGAIDTTEANLTLSGTVGVNGLDNNIDTADDYTDPNGSINFPFLLPDTDGDVNSGGDVDYRDNSGLPPDNDNDGIPDNIDLDDDNDGILDSVEDTPTNVDTDGDGVKNSFDLDADGDGIPDNIEAQTTAGYVAPGTFIDANNDGVNDIYAGGLTPVNTDGIDNPDYLDLDSDNDSISDNSESALSLSGVVGINGLDNNVDTVDNYTDVNGTVNSPTLLPNGDGINDVDFRDATPSTPPAGVAGSILWLRADKGVTGTTTVTAWDDQSGFNNNATATINPSKIDAAINFNPTIDFNGISQYMQIAGGIFKTGAANDVWMYSVHKSKVVSKSFILNETLANKGFEVKINNIAGDWRYKVSDQRIEVFGAQTVNQYNTWTASSSLGTTGPSGTNKAIYKDGLLLLGNNIVSVATTGINNPLFIGTKDGTKDYFNGDLSEVIVFNTLPTAAAQQRVESYLAMKYGITLNATNNNATIIEGDYVAADGVTKPWNFTTNSAFHNDVAIIGRDNVNGVLNQKQSKSINTDALVTIGLGTIAANNQSNTNAFLANNNFLAWGNNGTVALAANISTLLCSPEKTLNRTWKIVETGTVGAVKIAATGATIDGLLNTPNTLKLLKIADDAAFTTNVEYIPISSELINGVAEYTAIFDFNGTKFFTYTELNAIVWRGDNATWRGGTGVNGAPSASDTAKLLIIDAKSKTNGFINTSAHVNCAWVRTNSKLVVNNNKALTIDNQLVLDGEMRMIGNAQLIQTHIGLSQVSGASQMYIDQLGTTTTKYRYNYWTSPVTEVGTNTFRMGAVIKDGSSPTTENSVPATINFLQFDGSLASLDGSRTSPITLAAYWIFTFTNGINDTDWLQRGSTLQISPPQAFIMKGPGGGTQNYTFTGTPNDGDYTSTITAGNLSLLGNPYPSALDADKFITDNAISSTAIIGTLYFWEMQGDGGNHNSLEYIGGYGIRNLGMGIAASQQIAGIAGLGDGIYHAPGRYIAVAQGFFIASADGGTITFNNSQRAGQFIDGTNSLFFKAQDNTQYLNSESKTSDISKTNTTSSLPQFKLGFEYLNPSGAEVHRQIGLTFKSGNSFGFENGYDSYMFDPQPTDMYFKFVGDPTKYVISGIDNFDALLEIPVGIDIAETGTFHFMLDETININSNIVFYLKDTATNSLYNLSEGVVSLNLDTGVYNNRFFITFEEQSTLAVDDLELNKTLIYFDNNTSEVVIRKNNLILENATLFNVLGQESYTWKSIENTDEVRLPLKRISNGVFIFNLKTDKGIVTKKIFINK